MKSAQPQRIYMTKKFNCRLMVSLSLVALAINGCNVGTDGNKTSPMLKSKLAPTSLQQFENIDHEIITYYFTAESTTPRYSIPLLDTNTIAKELAQWHNTYAQRVIVNSILIVGQTGKYQLLASQPEAVVMLDGHLIAGERVKLEAGKVYHLSVDYAPKNKQLEDLKLQWITPESTAVSDIPSKNLFAAIDARFKPKLNMYQNNAAECTSFGLVDSSCNGIPDDWAFHGYTVTRSARGQIILESWDDSFHKPSRYTKFVSAIYKFSTADDPYGDYQKVTGIGLDKSISADARNPLIAALPIIHANVEKVILSKNINVSNDTHANNDLTHTLSSTKSATNGSSDDVGGNINTGWSGLGFTATGTVSYNHQWNYSASLSSESGTSTSTSKGWSKSLQMNEAEAAYFLPVIRYENVGTAPAYELAPTFNFMAKKGEMLLNTVTAKSNSLAQGLAPGQFYPSKGSPGVLVSGHDDFNSQPMKLNKQQLDALENDSAIDTFVTQITAKVKYFNAAGRPIMNPEFDDNWNTYLVQANQTTAKFNIFLPDGSVKGRMVAAQSAYDPSENYAKPVVTLAQALDLLGIKYNSSTKRWQMFDNKQRLKYEFGKMLFASDQKTLDEVKEQMDAMEQNKDITKIILNSTMAFNVCPEGKIIDVQQNKPLSILFHNCSISQPVSATFAAKQAFIKNAYSGKYIVNNSRDELIQVPSQFMKSYNHEYQFVRLPNQGNSAPAFNIFWDRNDTLGFGEDQNNNVSMRVRGILSWHIYSNSDGTYTFANEDNIYDTKILDLATCDKSDDLKFKLNSLSSCPTGASSKWYLENLISK